MLLAIDTSTAYAGVLLWEDNQPLHSLAWRSSHNHTAHLMPAVRHALRQASISARDLEGVAVALGPGGFSALRVGISAAKGLALPWGTPLVGVGTLETEAYPYAYAGSPVCPLLNVGRRDMAWACFNMDSRGWQKTREEKVTPNADLASVLPPDAITCGEGTLTAAPLLRAADPSFAQLVEYPGPSLRLWALARLAAERLLHGQADDPASLHPLYLRQPSITPPNPPRRVRR